MRRASRRDAGESLIVASLRAAGAAVFRLDGKDLPDLICLHRGRVFLLEAKAPLGPRGGSNHRNLRPGQAEFRAVAKSRGVEVHVVRNASEALAAIGIELEVRG